MDKALIKQACRTTFFLRHNTEKENLMSEAEKLVHACVVSRLDYRNSLLEGCPKLALNSLQLIKNAALRDLMRIRTRNHISPVFLQASLRWPPDESGIDFNPLMHVY